MVILASIALGASFTSAVADEASRVTWQPSYSGSCQDCTLIGQQMPYWDLTGAHYGGADISYASLHGSQADGAYFTNVTASHTDFSRAKLRNAHFADAVLNNCRLIGVDASGADFSGATLDRSDAREAKLIGANLTGASVVHILAPGTDFSASNATGAVFDFGTFRGATFNGTLLAGSSFVEADVAGASFRDARLHGANLARMIGYAEADFTGACKSSTTMLPPGLTLPLCADAVIRSTQLEAP